MVEKTHRTKSKLLKTEKNASIAAETTFPQDQTSKYRRKKYFYLCKNR